MRLRRVNPYGVLLAIEAVATLLVIKLAITLLRFESWRRLFHRQAKATSKPPDHELARRVVRAVDRATGSLPAEVTCLPRALGARLMLARRGHEAELQIGVNRDPQGRFEAHAWVEYDGAVIIGDVPDLSRYTKLPPWPAR